MRENIICDDRLLRSAVYLLTQTVCLTKWASALSRAERKDIIIVDFYGRSNTVKLAQSYFMIHSFCYKE